MEVTPNNSPSLVGLQITSLSDSTILTNSNFAIDSSVVSDSPSAVPVRYVKAVLPSNPIKLDETFPLDHSNPLNYIKFGSASDYFGGAIGRILDTFPYSFFVTNTLTQYWNILDYAYDRYTGKSSFRIPYDSILAPKGYYWREASDYGDAKYVLHLDYDSLEIDYSGKSYRLLLAEQSDSSGYIRIVAEGDPFGGFGNKSIPFHIRPNTSKYFDFWNGLDGFERYMLSETAGDAWRFRLLAPFSDSEGKIRYDYKYFYIYKTDGYNPDTSGKRFTDSINSFIGLGAELDEYDCDVYYRELMPQNLKDLNDDGRKALEMVCRAYGRVFDSIRSASLGIQNIFRLSYDGLDSTIQTFMPELAKTFGLRYYDFASFIGDAIDSQEELSLYTANLSIWRNLLINTPWMLAGKGSRKPIEFLFRYFGYDGCYYVFDEFFYRFERPSSLSASLQSIDPRLSEFPYREDLSPKAMKGYGMHFQSSDYFDVYERTGYDWDFLVDDIKSRSYSSPFDMNSKWVEVAIDPFKAIECGIYDMNRSPNICPPDCDDTDFVIVLGDVPESDDTQNIAYDYFPINQDVSSLDFNTYIYEAIFGGINARNRKVSSAYYPLLNLYNNYYNRKDELTCISGETYGASEALEYISAIDSTFMRTVRDFIPSTSKLIGGGVNIRNVAFARNKHGYKRGADESSMFVRRAPIYAFDVDLKYPVATSPNPPLLSDIQDAVGGTALQVCPLPCVPELTDAFTRGTEIEIVWECSNPDDIVGYDVERLIAGDCINCDFDLIESGDIIDGGNFSDVEEQKWIVLAEGLLPNADRFVDGTQVAGTDYFYRVKAYNACGEQYSDALYVDNVSTFVADLVQGAVGLALAKLEVYRWNITSYTATPNPGTFLQTQGYLAKMADGLYYPISYSEITDSGTLDRQEIGYREADIPGRIACGASICPQIYKYTLIVVSTDASIEIY